MNSACSDMEYTLDTCSTQLRCDFSQDSSSLCRLNFWTELSAKVNFDLA